MKFLTTPEQANEFIEELKGVDSELIKNAIINYLQEKSGKLERSVEKYENAFSKFKNSINEYGDEDFRLLNNDVDKKLQNIYDLVREFVDIKSSMYLYIKERQPNANEKRQNIENLSQLKKALVKGARFNIVDHKVKPEFIGQRRVVQVTQSNAIYSGIADCPDHRLSMYNGGKGLFMAFKKASNWEFSNGLCTNYNVWKTWEDGEQVEKRQPAFTIEVVKTA